MVYLFIIKLSVRVYQRWKVTDVEKSDHPKKWLKSDQIDWITTESHLVAIKW